MHQADKHLIEVRNNQVNLAIDAAISMVADDFSVWVRTARRARRSAVILGQRRDLAARLTALEVITGQAIAPMKNRDGLEKTKTTHVGVKRMEYASL